MKKNILDSYFTDEVRNYPLDECSKGFDKCCYWLFSDDVTPRGARARGDVPYTIVDQLNEDEKKYVKEQIHERLAANQFYTMYVIILVYWKDKEAIPLLKQQLENYKIRNKGANCDFSYEIDIYKDAIKKLKKA